MSFSPKVCNFHFSMKFTVSFQNAKLIRGRNEMADPLKILDDLSARARREDPPSIDISSRVLLRLSREARAPAWPMALVASGTAVAALVVLSISLPLFEMLTDPWSVFFVMAANVLP
jgi:hypothetical protein